MTILSKLIGLALIILSIYLLGQNIYFTNNVYPYWFNGIAADLSILALTGGIVMLFIFPGNLKNLGWMALGLGIILIFISSRAILQPTTLWQFVLSVGSFIAGFQLITMGRINF